VNGYDFSFKENHVFKRITMILLIIATAGVSLAKGVYVKEQDRQIVLENLHVRVSYDLDRGTYKAVDKRDNTIGFVDAGCDLDKFSTRRVQSKNAWQQKKVTDSLGKGVALTIANTRAAEPTLLLTMTLYEGKPFLVLDVGLSNTTNQIIQLKHLAPLTRAKAFPDKKLTNSYRLLDGNSGGGKTKVRRDGGLGSTNNLCLTFQDAGLRHTLVMGGLTYADYYKVAGVTAWISRPLTG